MTRTARLTICAAAIAAIVVTSPSVPAAANTTLPTGDFPACSASVTTYCIAEVTFIEGGVEKAGAFVPSGTATKDANGIDSTASFDTFSTVNYAGRWSYNGFPIARKHDGVYVRAYAPNASLGSDIVRIGIEPAGPATSATGQVGRAKDPTTNTVLALDKAMGIRVKVRLGGLIPALNLVAGENVVVSRTTDNGTPVLTFQGTPTQIPLASNANDCKSQDGKATALTHQLYLYMLWANSRDPFGVGGLTGDMTITSNGFCSLSTPVWNSTNKTFDFTASAPHFAPDGVTVNNGFYKAVIPAADAKLLFDLDPTQLLPTPTTTSTAGVTGQAFFSASTALEVEITETDGVQKSFTKNIGFDGSNFVVSALNFSYSTPKIRLKKGELKPVPATPRVTAGAKVQVIKASFKASKGVSYRASATSGTKTARLKCTKRNTTVTCVSKKVAKGSWTVAITPSRNGVDGAPATRRVRVR